ncbi:MAG: enoyl-CoA hydratase-related protein [Acidimicrobiales bacterium]|jgi:enoyl-CoA hydratase|nr:enoyl-CoA hydratase-related protein [Acidimicrobiales bacterium]
MTDASTTPPGPTLLVERDGPVLVLTMNRPERRNALVPDMLVRFADAWRLADEDDSIRCVILTGAGDVAYCAGGDLNDGWMSGEVTEEARRIQDRLKEDPGITGRGLLLTDWCRKPIIAAVNGQCLGGGCEMLQQTDIRIAEAHATFGVPEAKRGLIAGAGSTMRLKRQIPYAVAMDMLLTGRILDAEEALRWGLVTHLVPSGGSMAKAREVAEVICANGPLAVAAAKASVIETGWLPEAEAQPIEISHVIPVMRSADAREGMKAFAEKRTPRFEGR